MMRPLLILAGTALLAFAQPGFAQPASNPPNAQAGHQNAGHQNNAAPQNPAQLRQSIQHDLEQSGYTNVQVMPEAFLVRAHDRQGHPVTMMVEPGSVTSITDLGRTGSQTSTPPQSSSGPNSGSHANK
jgi:hypothetical protein